MATLAPAPHVEAFGDLFSVPSSDGHTRYTVAHRGDGTFDCTCPAGKRGIPCKHVRQVIEFAAREVGRAAAPTVTAEEVFARIGAADPRPELSLPCTCGALAAGRPHALTCPALTAPADIFECGCGARVPGKGVTAGEHGPYCRPAACRCPRACTTACLERGL